MKRKNKYNSVIATGSAHMVAGNTPDVRRSFEGGGGLRKVLASIPVSEALERLISASDFFMKLT